MSSPPLRPDSDFIVQESAVVNWIIGIVFFAMFVYGLTTINTKDPEWVLLTALIPAVFFARKGLAKKTVFVINKNGIYHYGRLITSWQHYIAAHVTQKEKLASFSDNFVLMLEYNKNGAGKSFTIVLPLTNTQNKSEEEIIHAISFFSGLYAK